MNDSDASFEAGSSKQFYQHTYSLWESSAFYNINNLSAYNLLARDNPDESFSVFSTPSIIAPKTTAPETTAPETSAFEPSAPDPSTPVIRVPEPSTSFWDTEKPEPARDSKNRRIISKESLYEEPDFDEKKNDPDEEKQELASNWTSQFWMKAGNVGDRTFNQKQPRKMTKNNIQKKLDIALSQPLKIDKAASMMAKMGWEGGALGKMGTGIVEPIAPNAVYAIQTIGFGQLECADRRRPRKPQIPSSKYNEHQKKPKKLRVECFNTNLMLQTLAFVRNDYEIEVIFDSKLTRYERKRIHDFVDDIMYIEDMIAMPCDNDEQMDLAIEIRKYNSYLLRTASEGEMPDRSLCLYKEAPDNMYLVTHRDLRDEPDDYEEVIEASLGNDEKADETNEKPDGIVEECNAIVIEKEGGVKADNENAIMTDIDKVVEDATKTNDKEMTDVNQDPTKEETNKNQSKVFKLNLDGAKHDCYMKKNKQTKYKKNKDKDKRLERASAKANKEKKVAKTNRKTTKFCKVTTNMLAKEDNPFLKSILSVQKESTNEPLTKNDLRNQILAYFTEFSKKKSYTQFKFLGAFEGIEIEAINEFINNVWMCLNDADNMSVDILSVMKEAKCGFAIREDSNGSAVIYKKRKEELGTQLANVLLEATASAARTFDFA